MQDDFQGVIKSVWVPKKAFSHPDEYRKKESAYISVQDAIKSLDQYLPERYRPLKLAMYQDDGKVIEDPKEQRALPFSFDNLSGPTGFDGSSLMVMSGLMLPVRKYNKSKDQKIAYSGYYVPNLDVMIGLMRTLP